jgi:AraC-like DNA-binding protein
MNEEHIIIKGLGKDIVFNKFRWCKRMEDHFLTKIESGKMIVDGKTTFQAGDYVFVPRNYKLNIVCEASELEPFKDCYIRFDRQHLRKFWTEIAQNCRTPHDTPRVRERAVAVATSTALRSVFNAIEPYLESNEEPIPMIYSTLMQQAIIALLSTNNEMYPTLFDFNEAWKIDILDFMEHNFREDLNMSDMATFTGRSLATFKRDFAKISQLSPMRWLIRRRLQAAHDEIQNGEKSIAEVYRDSGFNNRSHFTTSFKREFGITPNEVGQTKKVE